MNISAATSADLPALLEIQHAAFRAEADQYGDCSIPPLRQTVDDLRADLATKTFLKATDETGQLLGSIRAFEKDGICHLEKLSVDPAHQRQGCGAQLLLAVESQFPHAIRFELFTGHRSEGNIRLYQKLGYRTVRAEEISCRLTLVHMEKRRTQPGTAS
ncbi:MAG: hypothetical protein B9S32_10650 [Verrucomicrobia bacterium Tous-C9LFEB]|nr:MAG: hypothetical protein B9S32_10650 [Verrucomicrobia bacterium Tous-C9LFEB]